MKTDQDLIFEAYASTLNEEDESSKSGFENFYAEGETFADKLSDEGLQFAIKNFNQLKVILMDEFGYRRQMEKENNY